MKKFFLVTMLATLVVSSVAWATPSRHFVGHETLGPGLNSGRTEYFQNFNRTLSSDTLYTLTGLYYVTDGFSIDIPAGCVIQGDTAATLIVQPGGQIFANGTEADPIVMTSLKDPGSRNRGDWGGVILLGNAPVNKVDPLIEGGIISGTYGGADPDDSSGVFKYVRIEYPGYRFQLNNEVNGLTMGGVGRGTELHHVQVSYSFDDAFEWFGGTVDAKYLVTMGETDDGFDADFGYTGRVQWGFALLDPDLWDPTGETRGLESDNDGSSSSTAEPYTHPLFVNMTLVGPQREDGTVVPGSNSYDYSAVVRRSSKMSLYNSVIMGWKYGLSLRDAITQGWANLDTLQFRCVTMQASQEKVAASGSIHGEDRWAGVTTWYDTPAYNNSGSSPRQPSSLLMTDLSDLNNPVPIPMDGSELLTLGTDYSSAILQAANWDGFFDTTPTYRGAFDPAAKAMDGQWTANWTNFDPQGTNYFAVKETETPLAANRMLTNYPNPFNPQTTIKFAVPVKGMVNLQVFDMKGRVIETLVNERLGVNSYEVPFHGEDLPSGTYFYRLTGNGFSETGKMQLVK